VIRNLHLIETPRSAAPVWPSIASASAELRRPRGLAVVRDRAETPAATALATRPRLTGVPRGR
jgi:hypothetical protein